MLLVKLKADGTEAWAKAFGTNTNAGGDVGEAVAFDSAGNVVMTGDEVNALDFGGGLLTAPASTYDAFVAKFGPDGSHKWSKRFGRDWDDRGQAIATDPTGNVIVAGPFSESEDFGGGTMWSPGGADGFVAKFAP
jgi:hypothetical protein